MGKQLGLMLICLGLLCNPAEGSPVAFDFTGTVSLFSPVFGLSSSPATNPKSISGTFMYELASPIATTSLPCSGAGCASYEQTETNGFQAVISSVSENVTLSANNYLVQVKDDFLSSGETRDGISIIWRSDLTPALSPLKVDGLDQGTGQFRLDFVGLSSVFSGSSLPPTLDWGDFSSLSPPSLIGSTVSVPNGFITLTSLTAQPLIVNSPASSSVPEPALTAWLLMGAFCFFQSRRHRIR